MKKISNWISVNALSLLACFAIATTSVIQNRMCGMHLYQDKLPESAKKLRKF